MSLEDLLARYGLLAVGLGAAIEGDLTLILAGVTAHLGYFPVPAAIAAGALGNFVSDCVWYAIGRRHSQRFRQSRLYRHAGPTIQRLATKLGVWELIACRFVYGTKNASMVFWGLHDLPLRRFLPIDAISCAIGATVFGTLGYVLSGSASALIGRVKRLEVWFLGAVVLGILAVFLIHRLTKRRLHLDDPPVS